jgi:hypothetical protein
MISMPQIAELKKRWHWRSALVRASILTVAVLSLMACSAAPTKPVLYQRDPPPHELTDKDEKGDSKACPRVTPLPFAKGGYWVDDNQMIAYLWREVANGDQCRASFDKLLDWAEHPPKPTEKP